MWVNRSFEPRRRRPLLSAYLTCCALLLPPAFARASGGSKGHKGELDTLTAALGSGDLARADAAIDALGKRGDRASLAALAELVRQGQPDALTDHALRALGETHSPDALPFLSELTHHRRAHARQAAYAAAARIDTEAANELLAQGLRDSDPGVRGLCARSLGERGAKSQLDVLFRGLERGVPEAAVAIGRLAGPDAVARLHAHLGQLPIQVMLGGYEQLLLRDDVEQTVKLEIIGRLGEVAGLTVKRFLEQLLASKSWAKQPGLLHALSATAKRIDDRPTAPRAKP
jgi:HEAT repeat protein